MKSYKRIDILLVLCLALLGAGYFYSALDGTALLTERDLSAFFIPPRLLWVDLIKHGEFPLWNPYVYSGQPLLATLQPGVFYPLNILLVILPFDLAFNWTVILHFLLAGVFTYMLLKELKATPAASFIGALVFMLSGYLFSVHNVLSTLFTVTWVPLAILVFLRTLKGRGGGVSYAVLTGVILTVMFTGGGIEVLLGTVGLLFLLALMPAAFDFAGNYSTPPPPPPPARLDKRLLLYCVAVAIFLLLSAVQLLPFMELAAHSTRAGGLSWFEATTWSFDLKDFLQFFIPDPYGYGVTNDKYWSNQSWLKTVYTGTIPIILSFFFLVRARAKALPFIFMALLAFSLAMGGNNAFYPYLYGNLPFFDKIRYPVKFLFIPFVFVAVSAGLGYDAFIKAIEEKGKLIGRIMTALLVLSTIVAVAFGLLHYFDADVLAFLIDRGIDYPEYNFAKINVFNTKRVLFFFIVASITLWGGFKFMKIRKALPWLIVMILAADLFFAHNGYYATTDAAEYHKKGTVIEFLNKDATLYRVFVTPMTVQATLEARAEAVTEGKVLKGMGLDKERLTGYNLEHGIFDIQGVGVMKRRDYDTLYTMMTSGDRPDSTNILALMNVKYVISMPEIDSPEFSLVSVTGVSGRGPDKTEEPRALKIYENANYLARFFLVEDYKLITRPGEYAATLMDKAFEPRTTVLLEEDPGIDLEGAGGEGGVAEPLAPGGSVEVMAYRANSIGLKVVNPAASILVTSESWYPGWKVYVDGERRKILKANYAFKAVALEPGVHEVVFVYSPASFRLGALLSALTLSAIVGAGIFSFTRKGDRRNR
jgi:hypothetical protein